MRDLGYVRLRPHFRLKAEATRAPDVKVEATPDADVGQGCSRGLRGFRLQAEVVGALLSLLLIAAPAAAQAVHLAVIVGLAGDPEDGEAFRKWAHTLVTAAPKLGVAENRVIYLAGEPEAGGTRAAGKSTKAEVIRAFESLAAAAGEEDVVFVVLIGHGTFDGKVARFNLPGPDMTPADFAPLLQRLRSKHVVFVNAASASGPFLEALSGPGRTVITGTRNGAEHFTTLFGGYFVEALTTEAADADKNRRVSVLEAFNYARHEVANAYEREGIMVTEHALLDDSGTGKGTMEPSPDAKDGRVAAVLSLGSAAAAEPLPADPRLQKLYTDRRDLERRIEALKLMKGGMDQARYQAQLEQLATDLALKTRQIREIEGRQ